MWDGGGPWAKRICVCMTWIHQRKRNPKRGLKRENQRKRFITGQGRTLFIYFFSSKQKDLLIKDNKHLSTKPHTPRERERVIVRNLKNLQLESKFDQSIKRRIASLQTQLKTTLIKHSIRNFTSCQIVDKSMNICPISHYKHLRIFASPSMI